MTTLHTGISQLATSSGRGAARGLAQAELTVLTDAALAVTDGQISWVGARSDWQGEANETVDHGGRAVVPGLVDPHTHAVWAGERLAVPRPAGRRRRAP